MSASREALEAGAVSSIQTTLRQWVPAHALARNAGAWGERRRAKKESRRLFDTLLETLKGLGASERDARAIVGEAAEDAVQAVPAGDMHSGAERRADAVAIGIVEALVEREFIAPDAAGALEPGLLDQRGYYWLLNLRGPLLGLKGESFLTSHMAVAEGAPIAMLALFHDDPRSPWYMPVEGIPTDRSILVYLARMRVLMTWWWAFKASAQGPGGSTFRRSLTQEAVDLFVEGPDEIREAEMFLRWARADYEGEGEKTPEIAAWKMGLGSILGAPGVIATGVLYAINALPPETTGPVLERLEGLASPETMMLPNAAAGDALNVGAERAARIFERLQHEGVETTVREWVADGEAWGTE